MIQKTKEILRDKRYETKTYTKLSALFRICVCLCILQFCVSRKWHIVYILCMVCSTSISCYRLALIWLNDWNWKWRKFSISIRLSVLLRYCKIDSSYLPFLPSLRNPLKWPNNSIDNPQNSFKWTTVKFSKCFFNPKDIFQFGIS